MDELIVVKYGDFMAGANNDRFFLAAWSYDPATFDGYVSAL